MCCVDQSVGAWVLLFVSMYSITSGSLGVAMILGVLRASFPLQFVFLNTSCSGVSFS